MITAQNPSYRVLARKYRPQTLSQLVGQEMLVSTLAQGIKLGRLPHAFLLHGIRGVGKTTTARILAKALNCLGIDGKGGPTPDPCGVCDSCVAIAEDRHLDVIEMDAASRTGVDDVREVIEASRYKAVTGRYKVYIIDEVHMLSKSAFNALLKTLEEPPPHVKFIFATTEIRKVPDTVLSRCMRFDLNRIDPQKLFDHLKKICDQENVQIDESALAMIVRAGDGSARDSLSLLDQAIALAGEKVSGEIVRDMLGLADRGQVFQLLTLLFEGDIVAALSILRELYHKGGDPLSIIQELMDITYWITCLKTAPSLQKDITWPESDRQEGAALAAKLTLPILMRAWQVLNKGYEEVLRSCLMQQAAEMVLIRLAFLSDLPSAEDLLSVLQGGGGISQAPVSGISMARRSESASFGQPSSQAPLPQKPTQPPAQQKPCPSSFEEMIKLVSESREPLLASHLAYDVHLVSYHPGKVVMRLSDRAPATMPQQLRQTLEKVTGQSWDIQLSKEDGQKTLVQKDQDRKDKIVEEVKSHPLVESIVDVFPGAKVTVKV
jgi:DNA polymerase-3 subunit gamma/tau